MDFDRLLAAVRNVVLSIVSPYRYFGLFIGQAARVSVSGPDSSPPSIDGSTTVTVDIIPQQINPGGLPIAPGVPAFQNDPSRAQVNGVPMLLGSAGVVSTPKEGAFLLYGYMGGNPKQPYCLPWIGAASVQQIVLNEGVLQVARKTDTVDIGTFAFSFDAGTGDSTCTLSWTPPAGGSGSIGGDMQGVISKGNPKVLA